MILPGPQLLPEAQPPTCGRPTLPRMRLGPSWKNCTPPWDTCGRDLAWKQRPCRRSRSLGAALSPRVVSPQAEGTVDADSREKATRSQRRRLEGRGCAPRNARSDPQSRERREACFRRALGEAVPNTGAQTSHLQGSGVEATRAVRRLSRRFSSSGQCEDPRAGGAALGMRAGRRRR